MAAPRSGTRDIKETPPNAMRLERKLVRKKRWMDGRDGSKSEKPESSDPLECVHDVTVRWTMSNMRSRPTVVASLSRTKGQRRWAIRALGAGFATFLVGRPCSHPAPVTESSSAFPLMRASKSDFDGSLPIRLSGFAVRPQNTAFIADVQTLNYGR